MKNNQNNQTDDFEIKDGVLVKYHGSASNVIIPDGVTVIGRHAFDYCDSLVSVTIPDSVTGLGYDAFAYCDSLVSVTIPDSVTIIGMSAFSHCESLTSITISDNVTNIDEWAFYDCESLESIYVKGDAEKVKNAMNIHNPNSVKYVKPLTSDFEIKDRVLVKYHGSSFEIKDRVLVKYHGSSTDVVIPNGVTSIGEGAFYYCKTLESVIIPDSVTSIGGGALMLARQQAESACAKGEYYCMAYPYPDISNGAKFLGSSKNLDEMVALAKEHASDYDCINVCDPDAYVLKAIGNDGGDYNTDEY